MQTNGLRNTFQRNFSLGATLEARLPDTLDTSARERPTAAIAWLVIASAALLQLGRLGVFVTDRESDWWSARPPLLVQAPVSACIHLRGRAQ